MRSAREVNKRPSGHIAQQFLLGVFGHYTGSTYTETAYPRALQQDVNCLFQALGVQAFEGIIERLNAAIKEVAGNGVQAVVGLNRLVVSSLREVRWQWPVSILKTAIA